MANQSLQVELAALPTSADLTPLADRIACQPALLAEVFDGLRANRARVKFGCLKLLRRLSERRPAVLYPEFNRCAALLDSENKILQWGGLIVLGNLAAVDSQKRIERILNRCLKPISGPVLITAANAIAGAAKIARSQPHLADRIARALLRVERAKYATAECRNVALGKVVEAFDLFFDELRNKRPVLELVRRKLANRRNATRRKAAAFLMAHAPGAASKRARPGSRK